MIRLDSQVNNLATHLFCFFVQKIGQPFWNTANEHFSSVFREPNKMIAYLVSSMSRSFDHACDVSTLVLFIQNSHWPTLRRFPVPAEAESTFGAVLWRPGAAMFIVADMASVMGVKYACVLLTRFAARGSQFSRQNQTSSGLRSLSLPKMRSEARWWASSCLRVSPIVPPMTVYVQPMAH